MLLLRHRAAVHPYVVLYYPHGWLDAGRPWQLLFDKESNHVIVWGYGGESVEACSRLTCRLDCSHGAVLIMELWKVWQYATWR